MRRSAYCEYLCTLSKLCNSILQTRDLPLLLRLDHGVLLLVFGEDVDLVLQALGVEAGEGAEHVYLLLQAPDTTLHPHLGMQQ